MLKQEKIELEFRYAIRSYIKNHLELEGINTDDIELGIKIAEISYDIAAQFDFALHCRLKNFIINTSKPMLKEDL